MYVGFNQRTERFYPGSGDGQPDCARSARQNRYCSVPVYSSATPGQKALYRLVICLWASNQRPPGRRPAGFGQAWATHPGGHFG